MLKFSLNPIFKARGIERPYSFLVKIGLSPNTATTILNSHTRVFRLDVIEKICEHLHCTPHDILVWTPNKNSVIQPNHPLTELKKKATPIDLTESIKTMPLSQLNEIASFINDQKKKTE